MDYPFFAWRIGGVGPKLLAHIEDWMATTVWQNASGFDPRHQLTQQENTAGWSSIRKIITDELVRQLGPIDVVDVNINRMQPGGFIAEHTDLMSYGSGVQDYSWIPLRTHTIHIPITTNPLAVSKHRRSRGGDTPVCVSHLKRGGIYLYNNVAWHSVHNGGPKDRTHFFIKVRDDEFFTVKHRLLLDNDCPVTYEYKPANFDTYLEPFDPKYANTVVEKWYAQSIRNHKEHKAKQS
jgi:hypothetical protein